jgi:hypothetical protein
MHDAYSKWPRDAYMDARTEAHQLLAAPRQSGLAASVVSRAMPKPPRCRGRRNGSDHAALVCGSGGQAGWN